MEYNMTSEIPMTTMNLVPEKDKNTRKSFIPKSPKGKI